MTTKEIMKELESMGSENTVKMFRKHGATCPMFGVKVADLKKIVKKVKKNHELSLELWETKNSDARYLAALISDESKITKKDLNHWAKTASWNMISEYAVAWTAADSPHALDLGLKWIDDKSENVQSSGWSTLSSYLTTTPDDEIDVTLMESLINRAVKEIPNAYNRTKYTMNGFVIACGICCVPLHKKAVAAAEKIGKVEVDMNGTACKVPFAPQYIKKAVDKGRLGKKRKVAKC